MAPPRTIYLNWDAKQTFGGDVQAQDSLQGTAAASPTEQSYYTIEAGGQPFPTGVAFNLTYWCEVEYDIVWDEYVTTLLS